MLSNISRETETVESITPLDTRAYAGVKRCEIHTRTAHKACRRIKNAKPDNHSYNRGDNLTRKGITTGSLADGSEP